MNANVPPKQIEMLHGITYDHYNEWLEKETIQGSIIGQQLNLRSQSMLETTVSIKTCYAQTLRSLFEWTARDN